MHQIHSVPQLQPYPFVTVHADDTCDSGKQEMQSVPQSQPHHPSATLYADNTCDSGMLMSIKKIEQGLLFLIDKWQEKDAPQVQPSAEVHSITALTQLSFVIIVIICFILR